MRRRVMTVYVTLLIIAGLGLAIPLCTVLAARATASMTADRITDAARFAGLAESSVVTGSSGVMDSELKVYHDLYDIQSVVLDVDAQIVAASSTGLELSDLTRPPSEGAVVVPEVVLSALAGTRVGATETIWPWQRAPLLVAEPVVSGGEVIGVVVTSSPVGALTREVTLQWAVVIAGVLVLLGTGALASGPLTRWVLRPVAELDQAANEISDGDLTVRVPSDTGPPELRHVARSFNRMTTTITDLLSRQRTFVAYAGHQVRNPLAALRIRVETLGLHLAGQAKVDHALALEEVDRLTRTCDSLITLATVDDDDSIDLVDIDVQHIIDGRIRAWTPIAERAGADLLHLDGSARQVRALGGSLEQVLDALIDNALKFGGAEVVVELQANVVRDHGDWVEIVVRDNGPGLDAEQRRQAVRPFWRSAAQAAAARDPASQGTAVRGTDGVPDSAPDGQAERSATAGTANAAGGSGLGLSVVVTLVELQGGDLRLAEREDGQGMAARMRLPLT